MRISPIAAIIAAMVALPAVAKAEDVKVLKQGYIYHIPKKANMQVCVKAADLEALESAYNRGGVAQYGALLHRFGAESRCFSGEGWAEIVERVKVLPSASGHLGLFRLRTPDGKELFAIFDIQYEAKNRT